MHLEAISSPLLRSKLEGVVIAQRRAPHPDWRASWRRQHGLLEVGRREERGISEEGEQSEQRPLRCERAGKLQGNSNHLEQPDGRERRSRELRPGGDQGPDPKGTQMSS